MDRDRTQCKTEGLRLWQLFQALGVSKDQIAHRICVNKSSVSRAFDETHEFSFGRDRLFALRAFARKTIAEVMKAILQQGPAKLDVLCTDYETSVPCHADTERTIIDAIQGILASLLSGDLPPVQLPNNVFGATAQLGPDQQCIYIIATKVSAGVGGNEARIHEYEHLSDHFKERARQLRNHQKGTELRVRLPKKRF